MWLAIAFIASFFLIQAITPKPQTEDSRRVTLGDIDFPRANYGDPLPMIWGTVRHKSPIVSYYGNLGISPVTRSVKSGLFSNSQITINKQFFLTFDLLLCFGPDVVIRSIWVEHRLLYGPTYAFMNEVITFTQLNMFGGDAEGGGWNGTARFHPGGFNDVPDDHMTALGVETPAHNGIARIVFRRVYYGTLPTPKPLNFVLSRWPDAVSPAHAKIGEDSNPMEVAYNAMTQTFGGLGIDPAIIDLPSFQAAAETLHSEGFGMSMIVQNRVTGKTVMEECMRVADGLMFQEPVTGKIQVKLIRQDYVVGDLPVFDESNIIGNLEDFAKTTWASTYNEIRVSFKNREALYDTSVALAQDFANIKHQGRLRTSTISVPGVFDPTIAGKIATRQLALLSVPIYKCRFRVNRKGRNLRPGSVLMLNWSAYNLTGMVMRVTKVDLGTIDKNEILLHCVQDRFATDLPEFTPPLPGEFTPIDITANPVTNRILWEPPLFFALQNTETVSDYNASGKLIALAEAPSSSSAYFDLGTGPTSDNSDAIAVEASPYYGKGTLLGSYASTEASTDRKDVSETLIVTNMTVPTIQALTTNADLTEARDGSSCFIIGNEIFTYIGYTIVDVDRVSFPILHRGVLDSEPESHSAGADVWFVRSSSGLIPQLTAHSTNTFAKFVDRTFASSYDIDLVTPISKFVTGRASKPLPPQYLELEGSRTPGTLTPGDIDVTWRNRSREDGELRVYEDASQALESNTQVNLRWRVDGDPWTDVVSTGTSETIDTTGLTGLLEVELQTEHTVTGNLSDVVESIQATLA